MFNIYKVENGKRQSAKQSETRMNGVINQRIYNFDQFYKRTNLMFSNASNKPKSTVEFGYM